MPAFPPSIVAVLLPGTGDHQTNVERRPLASPPSKRKRARSRRRIVLRRQPSGRITVSTLRVDEPVVDSRG